MTAYKPGDTLGRYRIERPLGQGAMGEVYLARDPQIDRLLAVKTLRLVGVREDEVAERQQRMLREARTAGRLIHPHIVTLFDAGEQDGLLFLAFEYVPGSDLAVRLAAGPLPVGEALRVVREACAGLGHAHREGIVHRDVKPSNLLLDAHGRVKISDFGIAKLGGEATELTVTGMVMGSPHYMSPEQIRGEELDGRSDLFSLGIVLYEALSGHRPFAGETISTLVFQIVGSEPQPMAALRPGLEPLPALLSRLLAKDRQARFPDAAAVGAELAALEAALPAALLAAPAVLVTAPTDATVVMPESGGTGAPSAVVPAPPSAAASAPASVQPPAAPPESASAVTPLPPTLSSPVAVPPPPPAAAAPGSAASAAPPATLPAPPTPPHAGPSVVSGGSYAVPSLSGTPRRRLLVALAVLAALAVVVAGGLVLLRQAGGDGETVADAGAAGAEQALPAADLGDLEAAESGRQSAVGQVAGGTAATEAAPPPASAPGGRAPTPGGSSPSAGRTAEPSSARGADTRTPSAGGGPAGAGGTGSSASGAGADRRGAEQGADRGAERPDAASTPPSTALPAPSSSSPPRPDPGAGRGDDGAAAGPIVDTGMTLIFEVRPADAFVLLDGTVIGRAAEYGRVGRRPFTLPSPGIHRITLRRDGMEDHELRVRAAADGPQVSPIRVHMEPLDATDTPLSELQVYRVREAVSFKVDPPGARLMVDGEGKGLANRWSGGRFRRDGWLELPLGIHRLSFIAPGRRRVDVAVDVTAGASQGRQRIELVLPPLAGGGG